MAIGGFWAWAAYLFAGTGFAMPIVIAIIAGGNCDAHVQRRDCAMDCK